MNPALENFSASCYTLNETTFDSKISHMISACEHCKNLMVGIYDIEKNQFLYCNRKLKQILCDDMGSLMENGFEYLYSLINQKELSAVKKHLRQFLSLPSLHDRLTIRYHITNLEGENILIKHEILLRKLEKHFLAVNYFFDVTEKEQIEQYFEHTRDSKKGDNKLRISARESEVLHLVGEGYSSKQIADKLFISNHTAITHRKNLIGKFQVKNTAHLIKRASELSSSFY